VNAIGHPLVEPGVVGVEDAAAQDHLDCVIGYSQPDDGGPGECRHLVGQGVSRAAGLGIALGRGRQQDRRELEQPAVADGTGVHIRQDGSGVGSPEVLGYPSAEACRTTPSIFATEGQPESPDTQPRTSRCKVARQLGQGREPDQRAVGSDARTIHAGPTDHPHAPLRRRPRPRHGERVVAEKIRAGPSALGNGRTETLLVYRKIDTGQAVDACPAQGEGGISQPGGVRHRDNGLIERLNRALNADELVVARTDSRTSKDGATSRDEHGIGLRAPSVKGQDGGLVVHEWIVGSPGVGIKVAVVGGGSTYTPELVEGLCDHEDRMVVSDLVLLDPSEERREAVGGLSERILRHRGWGGSFTATADRDRALEGADFVVVQLRIGGQAARHVDETLPVGYGCLGQETTGVGGLAKALRTVPVVLELAEETAKRANPNAWFVDFTNPVGIVTQALVDDGHRAVGLCNVAIWTQRRLGHYLAVDPDSVEIEHVGLNHLTWIRSAVVNGEAEDRLPELFDRCPVELELESGVSIDVLRLQQALPSYYVHYYYQHDAEVAQQSKPGHRSRADVVAELETKLLREYRDPELVTKPVELSYRGGAFYSLAAVRLMASLHADTGDVQVVDMRNNGAVPGLPDDAVVETRAIVDADGAHPIPQRPLPPEMLGLVQHAKAYEHLAVRAARSGSRDDVVRALLANPLVGQYPLAAELADALLGANRSYLPRFFPD